MTLSIGILYNIHVLHNYDVKLPFQVLQAKCHTVKNHPIQKNT